MLRGMTGVEYLGMHNIMLRGLFRLLQFALRKGMDVWVENPGDAMPRLATGSDMAPNRFYDPRAAQSASLFRFREWLELAEMYDGEYINLLQCPLGSPFWKPTTFWATGLIAEELRYAGALECTCIPGSHRRARGQIRGSGSAARQSQEYPDGLSSPLGSGTAKAAAVRAKRQQTQPRRVHAAAVPETDHRRATVHEADSDSDVSSLSSQDELEMPTQRVAGDEGDLLAIGRTAYEGDEISFGAALPPDTREEVEVARGSRPRWASHRSMTAATDGEIEKMAYPEVIPDFHVPATPARRAGQPRGADPGPQYSPGRPNGRIHISQLYMPGVFDRMVKAWLLEANAAMRDYARGKFRRVPDRVITQLQLQPWARGLIWDCRDADDCVTCQPSDEHTKFPGGHQLNRELFRQHASAIGQDADIAETMGRGGLESYSETTLDSVFSMHHAGLAQEFAAAEKVIQAEIDNEFVSEAFTHPPFVPTRCNPRNVLIQTRTRIVPGSQQVEEYPKPRVLTDESHRASAKGRGAPTNEPTLHDTLPPIPPSSNEGVPDERRSLPLPSAVGFAKVTGIVNQACMCAGLRAEGYTVDASNAYTSLVRQRLDWWLGVFVWVDGHDPREALRRGCSPKGGPIGEPQAVTRNAIRLEVGQFMATQPQLPAREAWSQRRRALQADGSLPPEREHAQPWNVRSFIDDVNGVASDRTVRIPPHLRRITFDPALTSAVGGTPCADDSETAVQLASRVGERGVRNLGVECIRRRHPGRHRTVAQPGP